jgi:hypothetical protein
MSKLEKFIENNRDGFDDKMPSNKVWDNIEAAIITKKETKRVILTPFYKWSIAASIVLLISVSVFLMMNNNKQTETPLAKNENSIDSSIYKLAPEEAPQMYQFAKLIETKQEELKVLAKEQPQLYQKFTKDITQLDSSYIALKNQLNVTPNKEMLIEAMIQNLQLQLNVLNQQLNIIKQIKNSKSNSNEKNIQFM